MLTVGVYGDTNPAGVWGRWQWQTTWRDPAFEHMDGSHVFLKDNARDFILLFPKQELKGSIEIVEKMQIDVEGVSPRLGSPSATPNHL